MYSQEASSFRAVAVEDCPPNRAPTGLYSGPGPRRMLRLPRTALTTTGATVDGIVGEAVAEGMSVSVGGIGVAVGGTGVALGMEVAVGGTGEADGGTVSVI